MKRDGAALTLAGNSKEDIGWLMVLVQLRMV